MLRLWRPIHALALNLVGASAAVEVTEAALGLAREQWPGPRGEPEMVVFCRALAEVVLAREAHGPRRALTAYLPRFDEAGRLRCAGEPAIDGRARDPRYLRSVLVRLDALDRLAFVFCVVEQFPLATAASILRIAPGAALRSAHRAALMLTGMLAAQKAERPQVMA